MALTMLVMLEQEIEVARWQLERFIGTANTTEIRHFLKNPTRCFGDRADRMFEEGSEVIDIREKLMDEDVTPANAIGDARNIAGLGTIRLSVRNVASETLSGTPLPAPVPM